MFRTKAAKKIGVCVEISCTSCDRRFCFQKQIKLFLDTLIQKIFQFTTKINISQGEIKQVWETLILLFFWWKITKKLQFLGWSKICLEYFDPVCRLKQKQRWCVAQCCRFSWCIGSVAPKFNYLYYEKTRFFSQLKYLNKKLYNFGINSLALLAAARRVQPRHRTRSDHPTIRSLDQYSIVIQS